MEETYIKRVFAVLYLGKEDCVGMGVSVVVILAVAGESSEEHPLVLVIPFVDRKQDETLLDPPCIRKRSHERIVYHIPSFPVVLLLHIQNLENSGTGFPDSEASEFSENVRLLDIPGIAHDLDLADNLFRHVFVVKIHCEGILDRETATNIK